MTMNGIDVSVWQAADLSNVPYDFLIARATHGDDYVDPWADRHIQTAIRRGKPFGFYHFMDITDPIAQADWFVKHCAGYFGKGIPILDFEEIGGRERAVSVHGDAGARRFLDRVFAKTGVRPMIYANSSTARNLHQCAAGNYGLFVAEWNQRSSYGVPRSPNTGPWKFAFIHQYSSKGRLPGYNGDLDLDICYGDAATWAKYAAPAGTTPATTPKPTPPPANTGQTYTVKRGDTLWDIAQKYGTTVDNLVRWNNIPNRDLIHPGLKLRVR